MPHSLAQTIALLIVIADAGFIVALVSLVIPQIRRMLSQLCGHFGIQLVFLIALFATVGSLSLSEIAGYTPCDLCWYQRILMYPLVILFGLALAKKNRGAWLQGIIFAGLGAAMAIYHIFLQAGAPEIIPCSTRALAIPCGQILFRDYGYVTIPVMSLTAFAMILFVLIVGRREGNPK